MPAKLNNSNFLTLSCTKPKSAIIIFHGYGSDGYDLISVGKIWQQLLPNTVIILPHGFYPCDEHIIGRQWSSLKGFNSKDDVLNLSTDKQILDVIFQSNKYIDQVLDHYSIEPSNVALMGFSQGAMLALRVGLGRKNPVAAVMGYSGFFIVESDFVPLSFPPVALFHGEEDSIIPHRMLNKSKDRLKSMKIEVTTKSYPSLGHSISEEGVTDGCNFLKDILL